MNSKKADVQTIFKMALIFLKVNGIYLDDKKNRIIPILCAITGISLSGSFFVFCVTGVVVYWESFESMHRALGVPLSLKVFISIIITLWQKHDWIKLVNKIQLLNLHEKLNGEDRAQMDRYINIFIKFAYLYSAQSIISVVLFYLKSMFFLQLPLELYTPCDLVNLSCYIPYILYEILMDIFMIPFPLSINLLYIYIILAIICEIEAVKFEIRNIHAKTNIKETSVLAEQHNQVSVIVYEFRNIEKHLLLVTYLASTLLAIIAFYMINRNGFPPNANDLTQYLPLTLIFILEFYFYAYGANKLSESIESIGDEIYESNWVDITDLDAQKSLILMIQKSQTTKGLTIGGLILLDLSVFVNVMQNAFSFYTLMTNLEQEDM